VNPGASSPNLNPAPAFPMAKIRKKEILTIGKPIFLHIESPFFFGSFLYIPRLLERLAKTVAIRVRADRFTL
jgi:hypothetical protein